MLNSPKHISGCTYIWRLFKSPYWKSFHVERSIRQFHFWCGMYVPQPMSWQHPLVQWPFHSKAPMKFVVVMSHMSAIDPDPSHGFITDWLLQKWLSGKDCWCTSLHTLHSCPPLALCSWKWTTWAWRDSSLPCLWGYETHIYNLSIVFFYTKDGPSTPWN